MNKNEILNDQKEEIIPAIEKNTGPVDIEEVNKDIEEINEAVSDLELHERKDALKKIEELEKSSGLNLDVTQAQMTEEIDRAMTVNYELSEELLKEDMIKKAEKIKKNIINHIESAEYFEKLKIEFGGDEDTAKFYQRERVDSLNKMKITVESIDNVRRDYGNRYRKEKEKELQRNNVLKYVPRWLSDLVIEVPLVDGFYVTADNNIVIPYDKTFDRNNEVARHEELHASTRSEWLISENAKKLFDESYRPINDEGLNLDDRDEMNTYLKNYTERLVRKQALDLEMEQLGIKKYGEKFTKEHYKKMMECYRNKKFSSDAEEFIKTTKPGYFEKIFNEIAENEIDRGQKAA